MKELVLHSTTAKQMTDFMGAPSHAVLLVGPAGSGKMTLATKLSETILNLPVHGLADYPYKTVVVSEDGKAIGIEAVRELEHFLSLKVPSRAIHNRVVIIQDAHLLSTEAQNALLKTLEEPPEGTLVMLTANSEQALLPTIRSRAQTISVKRPEQASTEAYFQARNFDDKAIKQAYAISGGLTGLMCALLEQTEHPLLLATERARQLLSQSTFERLLAVDELSKQRPLALDTLFILQQMAHVSLQSATGDAATKWLAVQEASYQAVEALTTNAQPKLVMLNLMLSL